MRSLGNYPLGFSRILYMSIMGLCVTIATGCSRVDDALLNKKLIEAGKSGDSSEVRSLLDRGANANARNESQRTVLMLAALKGKPEVVELLVEKGAGVNERDSERMTPLMWAAFGGSRASVDILIKHGADTKARDSRGETALEWAKARSTNAAVVDALNASKEHRP
jgi:ankyrin repeat protein